VLEDAAGDIGQQNALARDEFCDLARDWSATPADHSIRDYVLRHGPTHLRIASRWDDLETLLTDLPFLEAKNEAGLVFDLAGDFTAAWNALPETRPQRRILRLLDEALRRDIHFINRHREDYSQGLFQCLWNFCWWHDCQEAAQHYIEPTGGWKLPPPWVRADAHKLCKLLEHWRREKRARARGSSWLRSLRAPHINLGTAQLAVLHGHEDSVNSVVFSPDGTRLASGSADNTLRVWDAQSGRELTAVRGHEKPVTYVAYSHDG